MMWKFVPLRLRNTIAPTLGSRFASNARMCAENGALAARRHDLLSSAAVMRTLTLVGTISVVAACAAQPQYTPTSAKTAAAKPSDCTFDILTMRPTRPIEELGVIDFEGGFVQTSGRRSGVPSTAADLREKIAADVCRSGGDAVVTEVNGLGQYVRATVVRYSPQPDGSGR